jgi:hypothetical protein
MTRLTGQSINGQVVVVYQDLIVTVRCGGGCWNVKPDLVRAWDNVSSGKEAKRKPDSVAEHIQRPTESHVVGLCLFDGFVWQPTVTKGAADCRYDLVLSYVMLVEKIVNLVGMLV